MTLWERRRRRHFETRSALLQQSALSPPRWQLLAVVVALAAGIQGTVEGSLAPLPDYDLSALEETFGSFSMDRYDSIETTTPVSKSSSSSSISPSGPATPRRARAVPHQEDEDNNYKSKEDWWKDPLSMFDDEDDSSETVVETKYFGDAQGDETEPDVSLFDIEDSDNEIAEDPVKETGDSTGEQPSLDQNEEEMEPAKPEEHVISSTKSTPGKSSLGASDKQEYGASSPPSRGISRHLATTTTALPLVLTSLLPANLAPFLAKGTVLQVVALFVVVKTVSASVWPSLRGIVETWQARQQQQGSTPRPQPRRRRRTAPKEELDESEEDETFGAPPNDLSSDEEQDYYYYDDAMPEPVVEPETKSRSNTSTRTSRRRAPALVGGATTPAQQRSVNVLGGLQNMLSNRNSKLPSAKELQEQVTELKERCDHAERQKSAIESAYEEASWELQEAQSELSSLKQTTQYLQAQLRDNEEMLQRVIKTERRKAKEDLIRLKEAMLKVIERERVAMREEFMKQASQMETMMHQKKTETEGDDY